MGTTQLSHYSHVIDEITEFHWSDLTREDLIAVCWAYYYFSVQFRENLEIACAMHPDDPKLMQLHREECDTDNLSPWPGVAQPGERMNHDEFMRRVLELTALEHSVKLRLERLGQNYLTDMRAMSPTCRALTIASYEDGGLEAVFRAFLRAPDWNDTALAAFEHFLVEHIRFDSDPDGGHGSLSRHLVPDDRILPAWHGFRAMLVRAAPSLAG